MNPRTPILAALFSAALSLGTTEATAQKLGDWEPGKTVAGDEVDFEKLKGRVVAIEYWGPR